MDMVYKSTPRQLNASILLYSYPYHQGQDHHRTAGLVHLFYSLKHPSYYIISMTPNHFVGKRIANNRIELVAILGEGSYGCVYRAIIHENGTQKLCAVKCLSKANIDPYHLMCQRREIVLHKQVSDGEGIVSLYEAFEDSDYQWLVLEYSSDGDLWERISEGCYTGNDDSIRDVFGQILAAVEYCHSKHVFHRDLKPENVLLTEGGRKVLLADFGLASGSRVSNELRCGSPWYMSPGTWSLSLLSFFWFTITSECWGGIYNTNEPYMTATNDIWCLGVLLINIACGRHAPWKHATTQDAFFRGYLRQPAMLRCILPVSSEVHDLLSRVFKITAANRISIHDFRIAVSQITTFTIPADERAEFYDRQRAVWCSALGPTSSHPHSSDIVQILPFKLMGPPPPPPPRPPPRPRPIPAAHIVEADSEVDITDAAKLKDNGKLVATKKGTRFVIRRIPIIDTSAQALRAARAVSKNSLSLSPTLDPAFRTGTPASSSSSSSSERASANSLLFPVTPQMTAAGAEEDIEIINISDADVPEDIVLPRSTSPLAKLADASMHAVTMPFQNILRAIRGL